MGAPVPRYRALRGSLRRTLRVILLWAANVGILAPFASLASVVGGRKGVYLGGILRGLARRNADQGAYWRAALDRYPGDPQLLRQGIEAALRAGRAADAEVNLAMLMARRTAVADDARYVMGLALVHQRRKERSALLHLLRSYLKGLRGTGNYRLAALRLSRTIFAFFGTPRRLVPALEGRRNRSRMSRMLDRCGIALDTRELLTRVIRCEQALADASPHSLFDTDVSRSQCELFIQHVHARLTAGEPFSFVRIGDGEAACLPYEPQLAWLARGDARERERIWWGKALNPAQRSSLHRRVFNAIWNADCIGIPTSARFLREIRLRGNDRLDRNLTGRGLRAILFDLERYSMFRGTAAATPLFTSCHLHQELARWNLYEDLLRGVRNIRTVSCHPDLPRYMEDVFGASIGRNVVLPPDCVSGPALRQGFFEKRLLPDMIDEVAREMAEIPRGSLVLVGAGYLGKWLIDVARSGGCVALDVGSVFDYWLGFPTRSYLDFPCA